MDIYSDDIIFQIATVKQKLDKKTIWDSIELMSLTSEEGICFYTVNEMSKILFPNINKEQCYTIFGRVFWKIFISSPISDALLQFHSSKLSSIIILDAFG